MRRTVSPTWEISLLKKFLISISTAFSLVLSLGLSTPANAAPDASAQGGSDGVLFMTEKTDGAIYVGDFKATPTAKSTYWQSDGSLVDEVAVTQTRVAWASSAEANPNATPPRLASNIQSKVLISNVGTTAGTITTVDIPNSAVISGLAADYFNERFYLTTKAGDIYSVKSDGTDLVKLISANASVQNVSWGFWFDSYNAKAYWCDGSQASTGTLTSATLSGGALSTPTALDSAFLAKCDGLGIDPATQTVFAAAYQPVTSGGDDYWMSYTQPAGTKTTLTIAGTSKRAPSSMFVSHATSKIYFTTEDYVYEVGYDGTGLRTLYTGTHTSSGFENLAVYYGKTLETINSVSASSTSIKKKVYFAPGSAVLTSAAKKTLNKIAKDYKTGATIDINGYVQKAGSASNNKALSKARAKAVAKYLKSKGVSATITYSGNGLPATKSKATKARRATVTITPN